MKHQALFHGDLVNTTRIIYTPSEFAKTSLLHIQEIGTLQAQKPHVSKREDLDSYLFFMVRSGSGELHYAHNTYPLGVGDCVFIDCRSAYFHETKDDLWSLSWVHFNGPSIDGIYQKYKERGGLPAFHANAFSLYEDCFNHLYSIVSGNSYVRDMQINEGLSALLTLLMEDSWHPDSMPAHTKRTSCGMSGSILTRIMRKKYRSTISPNDTSSTNIISPESSRNNLVSPSIITF